MPRLAALALAAACLAGCARPEPGARPAAAFLAADDDALVVLAKAVLVHGDKKAFRVWRCGQVEYRTKGGVVPDSLGEVVIEDTFQLPGRFKRVTRIDLAGKPSALTLVVDRGKAWRKKGDAPAEPASSDLGSAAQHFFADSFNLGPLTKDAVRLSRLPDADVDGEPAAVLRARSDALGEADYYFGTRSGLLLRSRKRVGGGDRPAAVECRLSEYKAVQGVRVPWRIVATVDGKASMDVTLISASFADRFDDGTFAKP